METISHSDHIKLIQAPAMDWFSWLSKTNLDPSLICEYGLEFARNELQAEDLVYFNHEFLQSMGISVAKHRLEILKLSRKEVGHGGLSKLVLAISKTRKGLKKCITRLVFPQASAVKALPEAARYGDPWRGALTRNTKTDKELGLERPPTPAINPRRQAKSGPIDRRMQENLMLTDKSLKLSGPLDAKVHEKMVFAYTSPKLYGTPDGRAPPRFVIPSSRSPQPHRPLDGGRASSPKVYGEYNREGAEPVNGDYEEHSLWAALFQDMKPT